MPDTNNAVKTYVHPVPFTKYEIKGIRAVFNQKLVDIPDGNLRECMESILVKFEQAEGRARAHNEW